MVLLTCHNIPIGTIKRKLRKMRSWIPRYHNRTFWKSCVSSWKSDKSKFYLLSLIHLFLQYKRDAEAYITKHNTADSSNFDAKLSRADSFYKKLSKANRSFASGTQALGHTPSLKMIDDEDEIKTDKDWEYYEQFGIRGRKFLDTISRNFLSIIYVPC